MVGTLKQSILYVCLRHARPPVSRWRCVYRACIPAPHLDVCGHVIRPLIIMAVVWPLGSYAIQGVLCAAVKGRERCVAKLFVGRGALQNKHLLYMVEPGE